MSQNTRNKPNDQEKGRRALNDDRDQKNYEGFEGMNFEQIRQPYNPSQQKERGTDSNEEGQGKGRP
ncbi:MAG TPA: hypothetical protein VFR58_08085 [Flavisolibacter sp.]|nr:hypothetical protein [Flavisolibacter sp.]